MTPKQLISFYTTQTAAAQAIGVTQPAISAWLKKNKIPELQQLRVEKITGGALKAGKSILHVKRKVSHV